MTANTIYQPNETAMTKEALDLLTKLVSVTTLMFEEILLEFVDLKSVCCILPYLSVRIRSVFHPASTKHINWYRLVQKRCDSVSFDRWQDRSKLSYAITFK